MALGRFSEVPRAAMTQGPTPLERLDRLSAANTGARLWAKYDDAVGPAFGGNKTRQLEYYFGAALDEGADTVLITGAVQSNFCRMAAAFAAKLGLTCHIQQEERVAKDDPAYRYSGNVLVSRLLGAVMHHLPIGEDEAAADRGLDTLAARLRAEGAAPYVIHLGLGHPPLGALGYIHCAREVLEQSAVEGVTFDHIVVPSGSGSTHAGFLYGMRALGSDIPITGICVRRAAALQKPRIEARCQEIADYLGAPNPVPASDVVVNDRFLVPGYGLINAPTARAIQMGARTEALILDPVYTGKCMAGALAVAGNGRPDQNVLFLHTGGTPGLFAYADSLDQSVLAQA